MKAGSNIKGNYVLTIPKEKSAIRVEEEMSSCKGEELLCLLIMLTVPMLGCVACGSLYPNPPGPGTRDETSTK